MHLGRISQTYKRSSVVISRLKWALCCDRKSLNSPQRPKALKPRPRGTITNAGQGSTNGIRSETNVRCITTMFAGLLMVPFRLSRKKKYTFNALQRPLEMLLYSSRAAPTMFFLYSEPENTSAPSRDGFLYGVTRVLSVRVRAEYKLENNRADLSLVAHHLKLGCFCLLSWLSGRRRANM